MISIQRAINGISLNGNESLLDEDGEIKLFRDKQEAYTFLRENGGCEDFSDENLEDAFWFVDPKDEAC